MKNIHSLLALQLLVGGMVACSNIEPAPTEGEQEVITTVELTFTPPAGAAVVVSHADPENDGSPVIDDIVLDNNTRYAMTVTFTNELSTPAEDITGEVLTESDEHQVLVYGAGVAGRANASNDDQLVDHTYDDEDANGFPVGLSNTIGTVAAGTSTLQLMLRHMPPEGGAAVKNATVAADFSTGGSTAIGGDIDVDVSFSVRVE
jgi:hypothetical protein